MVNNKLCSKSRKPMSTLQDIPGVEVSTTTTKPHLPSSAVEYKSKWALRDHKRNNSQYKIEAGTGKRVHIGFNHHGLHVSRVGQQQKQEIKDFLMDIWTQFGKVAETYYHKDFEYVYVTFRTHEYAVFGLHGLSDPIEVQAAIVDAIGEDEDRAIMAKQLFIVGSNGNLLTPSWSLTGK